MTMFSYGRQISRVILFLTLVVTSSHAFAPNPDKLRSRIPTFLTAVTKTPPTEWQGEVLGELKQVIDPDLNADIVTLGFVKNLAKDDDNNVSFDVELTTPACPVKDQFQQDCEALVRALDWVGDVEVRMTAQPSASQTETTGMMGVGAVIAVSSCKGGVGKSTTSVNLAYALQSLGASVGILDADVYGPSLPTMVTPDDDVVRFIGRQIAPLQRNGVKLMSFGYVNDGSAVMRGPMVTQLLDQFMGVVQWGQVDYLILDMPPGTGDIQLTLTQRLNITAAVIVTTPQELSFADVVRGVEMFDSVQVPCVAVVENMAYYEVDKSRTQQQPMVDEGALAQAFAKKLVDEGFAGQNGATTEALAKDLVQLVKQQQQKQQQEEEGKPEQIRIFGPGHKRRLSEQWGIDHTFSMPLMDQLAKNGDSGTPFVLEYPDSRQATIFKDLAKSVVSEVAKVKFSSVSNKPHVEYNREEHLLEVTIPADSAGDAATLDTLKPSDLRRACRCAACVEELTGRQILMPTMVSDNVAPLRMNPTGNYALSVDWSDGHRSLYPYRQLLSILQEEKNRSPQDGARPTVKEPAPVA